MKRSHGRGFHAPCPQSAVSVWKLREEKTTCWAPLNWSYWLWIVLFANSTPVTPLSVSEGCQAMLISVRICVERALPVMGTKLEAMGGQTAAPHVWGKRLLAPRRPLA